MLVMMDGMANERISLLIPFIFRLILQCFGTHGIPYQIDYEKRVNSKAGPLCGDGCHRIGVFESKEACQSCEHSEEGSAGYKSGGD